MISSTPSTVLDPAAAAFLRPSARRLLVLGGIGLILVGMIFGDIFAVFVLHQNAARVGAGLSAVAHAALAGDPVEVGAHFADVGSFLENRGTKVDVHVHMIDFGYLALLLALVQPWVAYRERMKRHLAHLFLIGSGVLPVGVFLIHYVGLAYSPLRTIGWASIFADLGGVCVLLATAGFLVGTCRCLAARRSLSPSDDLLATASKAARRLLAGGVILVLLGFGHGAYYAAFDLYRHENLDYSILSSMATAGARQDAAEVDKSLSEYGQVQGDKAVKIAAHAHIIEFGLLAVILAFFQPYVCLREEWKQRWVSLLLLGSTLLPVCVLLELRYGLLAGGIADVGGLMVIIALLAMWTGVVRYRRVGRCDGSSIMSGARQILVIGGIALAVIGMCHGTWYAVFAEHQAINRMGGSLAAAFMHAAQRQPAQLDASLEEYREAKYRHERQVDAHGHWIGLAMLLIVLGVAYDRVAATERQRLLLAIGLLTGAVLFPLSVLLQTISHGPLPRGLAIAGSGLMIAALVGTALGLALGPAGEKA